MHGIEADILLWIQDVLRMDWLNPFVTGLTTIGNAGICWIVLTLLLLCFKKTRRVGALCALALIGSLLINNVILKNLVARVRPYDAIAGLSILVRPPTDYSFPSGHSAASFAAGVVMFRNLPKKAGIPLLVLACLISLSRLYVGVHYPTDVLFGILSGTLIAIGVQWLVDRLAKKEKRDVDASDF